jgi:hypothetical protein
MARKLTSFLTMRPGVAIETFVFSSFICLMWLLDGEHFIEISRCESLKLLITRIKTRGIGKLRCVQDVVI